LERGVVVEDLRSGVGGGNGHLPAQVTCAGLSSLLHTCSTTSQRCQSAPLHRMAGASGRVVFGVPLLFPAMGPGGSSGVGGPGWAVVPAEPQPSARHTASAAWRSQRAPQGRSQDAVSRTSTVPLQRLLPFTRRTPSRSPGRVRGELRPHCIQTPLFQGGEWGGQWLGLHH
jgi:hypothetical protein